jgi:glutathione S-transferase
MKVTYFNMDGSRGETIRLALSIAGIEFEDNRISFQEFGELKNTVLPLGCVPVVEIDGEVYTQSNAINRYIGKQAGLYPNDFWQAYLCDEAMDIIEDAYNGFGKTMGLEGEELKAARENLVNGKFKQVFGLLQKRLEAAGGKYFADNKFTVADLKVLEFSRIIKSGMFDHIPTDFLENTAPLLVEHMQRVMSEPGVAAYYENRKQ